MNGNKPAGTVYVNGEEVAEAVEIQFELEAEGMGVANPKFKVGERVKLKNTEGYLLDSDEMSGVIIGINRDKKLRYRVYLDNYDDDLGFYEETLVKEDVAITKQYRTEKRKARAGERIIVTNAVRTFGDYDNGDIFTVKRFSMYNSGVMVEELKGDAPYIGHDEYEVIIEETQPTPTLAARVTELEAKVAALETQLAKVEEITGEIAFDNALESKPLFSQHHVKKTPNARRAAVIKQARAYVADYDMLGNMSGRGGFKAPNGILCDAEFFVNIEKRTVVCLLRAQYGGEILSKGIAKCAPDDVFNADIGKAIALPRAKGVKVPAEFLNAPKPTEVVVGMVVNYFKDGGFKFTHDVNAYVLDTIRRDAVESSIWDVKIVDDTEAQYS